MRKELFEKAKSVDLAIEAACEKLGCSRDACEWEIIDLPKKGFLGLKNTPAKVRVSVEIPDAEPVRENMNVAAEIIADKIKENIIEDNKPPKIEKPKQKAVQPPTNSVNPPLEEKLINKNDSDSKEIKKDEISEKEKLAKDYLSGIIEAAGLKADYVVTREYGGSCINIVGEGLGTIIGRRGETLDAIQYLTGLVANRGGGDYLRLTIDCGDYRLKRKETLESLAKKLANQVMKTNMNRTLEPMNPFERRIIHAKVSEIEGVSSYSVGEEPNRRVVITSPTARQSSGGYRRDGGYNRSRSASGDKSQRPARDASDKPAFNNRERESGSERGGYNRGRPSGDRRMSGRSKPAPSVPQGPPKKTPEADVMTGISFGKIDLE